jgi:HSP20 family molecular chaperone IbpA
VSEGQDRFVPAVDLTTRGDDLIFRVELPGIDPDKNVDVTIEGNILRIKGERAAERKEEEREGYYFQEIRYGTFERDFHLPDGVTEKDVSAEYRDGVLEVKVAGAAKQLEAPIGKHITVTRAGSSRELPKDT